MAKLRISHITQYKYESSAIDSVNELRLTPQTNEYQHCKQHTLEISPTAKLFAYKDYFGNVTHFFTIHVPHHQLEVKMESIVETAMPARLRNELTFEEEKDMYAGEAIQNDFAEFLMETPYTVLTDDLHTFVKTFIQVGKAKSTYQLLEMISHTIYEQLTYDPNATNVHTTLEETLQLRRGVCQDYAHLMIGVCRIFCIPARYVSGYHFIGDPENRDVKVQHASHAWVEAYIPVVGWVPFDPTNDGKIDWRYVKTSHGRDYSDVAPVKGVYKGSAMQHLHVTVNVEYISG